MIKIIQSHVIFLLFVLFFQTTANARVIQVPIPGNNQTIRSLIKSAVSNAIDGDVISLPEGEFAFDSNVVIRKLISFRGAGIGKTILYRPEYIPDILLDTNTTWNGMLKFVISNNTTNNIVVSDITFKSKYPSIVSGDTGSLAKDFGIIMFKCTDFIITRCRFEYFGNAAIEVTHSDTLARGLIFNNEFYHNSKGFDGNGLGYGVAVYGDNDKWITDPNFGSDNFIFIEDNVFDFHRHAIAAGGAALYVARRNIILNSFIYHAIDTHDGNIITGGNPGNGNYFSTRAVEVYDNTITNTKFKNGTPIVPGHSATELTERAIAIRGAEALVYNNTISGFRFGCGINIENKPPDSTYTYPIPYTTGFQSGVLFDSLHTGIYPDTGKGDLFYWGNNFTPYYNDTNSYSLHNYQFKYFKLHRDYHTVLKPLYTAYSYPHPLRSLLPTKPLAGTVTHPTCALSTGSVILSGLPTGNWLLNPGSIAGSGSVYTVTGLSPGTYNFTVTNAAGHNSEPSESIVIYTLPIHAKIKLYIQGLYNFSTDIMVPDTANIFLRSSSIPYSLIDSAKSLIDASGSGDFYFKDASDGKYYLQIKSINSVETWSRSGGDSLKKCSMFIYDFTTAAEKAFGSNMIQADTSPVGFAIFSGDINQDGIIDAADLSGVENDAVNSISGYIVSDLNGDYTVDASDLSIVENNVGVSVIAP